MTITTMRATGLQSDMRLYDRAGPDTVPAQESV